MNGQSIGCLETTLLSGNSDLFIQSDSPLLDKVSISITADTVLQSTNLGRISRAAEMLGQKIKYKYPRTIRRAVETGLHCRSLPRGLFRLSFYTDVNGIKYLRADHWEPDTHKNPPRGFDGNTNLFQDSRLYKRSKEGLHLQLAWLHKLISSGANQLNQVCELADLAQLKQTCRFKHLEFALHVVCEKGTQTILSELIQRLRALHNGVQISENGARVVIGKSTTISLYQKSLDVIRLELRLMNPDLDKYAIKNSISENIERVLRTIWDENSSHLTGILTNRLIVTAPLAFCDALEGLIKYCSIPVMPGLISRLVNGDGVMIVSSSDKSLYSTVRKLKLYGILKKVPYARSRYELTAKFKSITLTASQTARYLESKSNGEKI